MQLRKAVRLDRKSCNLDCKIQHEFEIFFSLHFDKILYLEFNIVGKQVKKQYSESDVCEIIYIKSIK